MGQVHVWKYIHIVVRHPGALHSINRKTELRTTLDKCTYTEYLASGMHKSENLVTHVESAMTAYQVQMELETGIQGLLQGHMYLFDEH
jgi:hypothetical protein